MDIADSAAKSSSMEVFNLRPTTVEIAAEHGNAKIVRYLRDKQHCGWANSVVRAAAGGHIGLVRWMISCGAPHNPQGLVHAAMRSGQVRVAQYVRDEMGISQWYSAVEWAIQAQGDKSIDLAPHTRVDVARLTIE